MERRKFTRFVAQDNAYAVLGDDFAKVGKVYDISLNGLACVYPTEKISHDTFTHVDIFLSKNGFYLSDVPCKIVYEAKEFRSDSNSDSPYRCGLKFETLETEHEDKLAYFLNNHVIRDTLEGAERKKVRRSEGKKVGRAEGGEGNRVRRSEGEKVGRSESKSQTVDLDPDLLGKDTVKKGIFTKIRQSRPDRQNLLIGLIDFLLLNIALVSVHLIKRSSLELSGLYVKLFSVFYLMWLGTSLAMKKFKQITGRTFFESLALIVKSNIVMVYLVSFCIVLWAHLAAVSRAQTFGVCGALCMLELVTLLLGYLIFKSKFTENRISSQNKTAPASTYYPLIYIDVVLLMTVFLVINYIKRGGFALPARYDQMILVLYGLLFISSFLVKKYDKNNFDSTYLRAVTPCIKATLIICGSLAVIVFALRLFYYSRLHMFGTFVVLFGFEVMVYYVYYAYRKRGKLEMDIESADEVRAALDLADQGKYLPEEKPVLPVEDPVEIKLRHALEFFSRTLFDFIKKNIDLAKIDRSNSAIVSTDEIADIQNIEENRHCLFINLHKTNDVRWFNRYFLQVYSKMKTRGYFIGKVHTIGTHKKHYMARYPKYIALLFYCINFIWCRVFPKLPYVQKIYFTITKGRNRMVSKAEIFGRLCFCGFEIIDELEIENRLFFIAQKVKRPSLNKNPSYGPIVRLQRSGFNGNMITVYKFRTMYPYSEFLQEYIYQKNQLDEGGKFKDDFRVTDWGKFMRATWLDELPMIYNWLKGDLKLFGVRPLSKQYLYLYTKELQELRKQVMPGLIPPFYADLPETLPEIMESEWRYIQAYLKEPLKTQVRYTLRSTKNILFNRARSH